MTSETWVIAVAAMCLCACADFERGAEEADSGSFDSGTASSDDGGTVTQDDAGTSSGDAGSAPSYATSVHPLMASSCEVCHTAGGQAASSAMVLTGDVTHDYAQVHPLVDTASPAASRLLLKASGQSHGGSTVFAVGSAGYETLLAWISGGANP